MKGTLLHQLFAAHDFELTETGSPSTIPVDHIYGHDRNTFKIVNEVTNVMGKDLSGMRGMDRFRLYMDHYSPPPTIELAQLHVQQRRIAREHGATLNEIGSGVGHQIGLEQYIGGGQVVIGVDTHTCTAGALGALAFRQPHNASAEALASGMARFFMPDILRIEFVGELRPECGAKDIALRMGMEGEELYEGKLLEIGGPGLRSLGMSGRFTLANLSVDLHARTALLETDDVTRDYLEQHGRGSTFFPLQSDPSAYSEVHVVDLATVVPMVAFPPSIFFSRPVEECAEPLHLDVVTVGSCTNGRYEDFIDFMEQFGNGPVAPGTRLIATPASRDIYLQLLHEGILDRLVTAGAVVNPPGCGPCMGLHQGILYEDEVCLATGSINRPGRMGSKSAQVLLAGPKVAGISARTGYLTAPVMN
ncbi:MAG TPA: aconitase family protein [Candidatus Kapabacteria bacterium]|nr:aconitase family protein [Candidatus Kapabacteria bacterium]